MIWWCRVTLIVPVQTITYINLFEITPLSRGCHWCPKLSHHYRDETKILATDMHNGYRPKKCQNTNFLPIFLSAVHFLSFHPAEVTHTRYGLYIAKIIICLLQTRRGIIIVPVIFYSNAGVCYSSSIVWTFLTWQIKKNASMSVAPAGLKIHTRFCHGLEAGQKYYTDFLH